MPLDEAFLKDYPWTKRAGIAAAGTILGLLAAKAATGGHSPITKDPVPAPAPSLPTNPSTIPQPPAPPATPAAYDAKSSLLSAEEAMDFIEEHEGVRYRSYRDSRGKKTVGVGFNLQAPGARQMIASLGLDYNKVRTGRTRLTQDQVEDLFQKKTEEALAGARRNLADFDSLPKDVQLVVVDMIYNLGMRGFLKFDTMVDALRREDYNAMANAMWRSAWRKQVGGRAERLISMVRGVGNSQIAMRESIDEVFRS